MNRFLASTCIYSGSDSLNTLKTLGIKRAFIICDPFMVKNGVAAKVQELLASTGAVTEVFSDIVPDPPLEIITEGVRAISVFMPDSVVAIGGGSAIDSAKAISYMYQQVMGVGKPLCIAVPTTSGTGSEVTTYSVITDTKAKVKIPIVDDKLLPNISVLDPGLVKSVPASVTADTGMDVLTHAMESIISVDANDFTDAFAEKAIFLVFNYLPRAVANGSDMIAREKMHNASCMAGMAFNNAQLGINHSLAHALGAHFHIPHGRANALFLPFVIEYNTDPTAYPGSDDNLPARKMAHIARMLGLPSSGTYQAVRSLIDQIFVLKRHINSPMSVKDLGVSEGDFMLAVHPMVNAAMGDSCTLTNPRTPTESDLAALYKRVYDGK